jgi:benzoate-CoA ligase family protein
MKDDRRMAHTAPHHSSPVSDPADSVSIRPGPVVLPRQYNAATHFIDRHLSQRRGGKTAFIDDRGSHTYADLAAHVNRVGNVLLRVGVQPGQRVLLSLLDGFDFPALFFGALKIGAVPVPLSTFLTSEDYDFILRDSAAAALALSAPLLDRFEPVLRNQPFLRHVIVAGAAAATDTHGYTALDAAAGEASAALEASPTLADEVGFWLYSSGSTGRPKGVLHRHGDLVQTAVLYGERVLDIRDDDVLFSASKMFFAYGLGNSCTFPLHAGATAVLMAERPTPQGVVRVMRAHQPTVFFGVPTLFASILSHCEPDTRELSARLRACVSAGEALPPAVAEHWAARFGVEILDGLGSTESLHIVLTNRPGAIRRSSSGQSVAGYDVSVRDDDGREAGSDEIGDLWVRGPSIATGYWNNPEASARVFVEGWLRTGDKYTRDRDGYYFYAGRADDMLKVGGLWVSPIEVESVLLEHPDVFGAAVIGETDADSLVKPKAFVVPRDPEMASPEFADALRQFVKDRLAHYKAPRWIEFLNELPRTPTGKIRRNELRKKS